MKTIYKLISIHTEKKLTKTFTDERLKQNWLETEGHNYLLLNIIIKP